MSCPGYQGLVCIDGYLYSAIGGAVFPANKRCETCNPAPKFNVVFENLTKDEVGALLGETTKWGERRKVISETLPEKTDGETEPT